MTRAGAVLDSIETFFDGFDELGGTHTDTSPIQKALVDAGTADELVEMLPHASLRLPQFSLLEARPSTAAIGRRMVANREQHGYADSRRLSDALDRGAVLRVERPDLRSAGLRAGLSGLHGALDDGSLGIFELQFQPSDLTLRFGCETCRYLVTQRTGSTQWSGSPSDPRAELDRLRQGASRQVGSAGTDELCTALEPSRLLVLAYAPPGVEARRRALAAGFLRHLDDSGDAERHHLVAASGKVHWLRQRLDAYLEDCAREPDGAGARLNLLGPASGHVDVSVTAAEAPHRLTGHE